MEKYEVNKMKKKEKKERKPSYLKEVHNEMKRVTFPSFKTVMKYSFATILIVAFLTGFFLLLSAGLSTIKGAL